MPLLPWKLLEDEALPSEAEALILPGGFPENFAFDLSKCSRSLKDIRSCFGKRPIYAECGGMLILGNHLYDRSGNGKNAATLTSMPAPDSDTKLLIHSNKDLDGDTNIVDSSPSAHLIDRVVTLNKFLTSNA